MPPSGSASTVRGASETFRAPRRKRVWEWLLPALLLLLSRPCPAHVADTSLLRISIFNNRLRIEFNLDLQTLSSIHAVDHNGDGEVDRSEFEDNLSPFHHFFQEKVQLTFNGSPASMLTPSGVEWQSISARIPKTELRNAHIQFAFENFFPGQTPCLFRLQLKVFETLGESHRIILGVVEGETSEQAVLTQSEPAIEYTPRSLIPTTNNPHPQTSPNPQSTQSAESGTLRLLLLGIEHILTGYDHLLFLLTLLLAVGRWKHAAICVSAFTAAHSITLALAALEYARLPERWVESAIAASILWAAARNFRSPPTPPGWKLTFGFGLLHGFGFANLFRELHLPGTDFLRGVLAFNLGVEAGQIAVLVPVLPALLSIRKQPWQPAFQKTASGAALLASLFWLTQRLQS